MHRAAYYDGNKILFYVVEKGKLFEYSVISVHHGRNAEIRGWLKDSRAESTINLSRYGATKWKGHTKEQKTKNLALQTGAKYYKSRSGLDAWLLRQQEHLKGPRS